ncbi:hypothetical protein TNCV_106041 [Trichonephila clavipes]|nr:hypothetical protein TNCV_106041 [Trichonephila clavipes]
MQGEKTTQLVNRNETTQLNRRKTTQLSSRNETTQLVSRNETTQLVSRNETAQLCTDVDRLRPPTTPTTAYNAYNRLQPPATAYNRLQPPATACNRLQPPTTACNRLQPPATACTACTAFTAESAFLPTCHEFEPGTTEDPSAVQTGSMHVKYIEAQTSSHWCSVEVWRWSANSSVVLVNESWFKMTGSVAKNLSVAK